MNGYEQAQGQIAGHGYNDVDVSTWTAWPWDGQLTPRALEPPAQAEPDRAGLDESECLVCAGIAAWDTDYLLWRDEHWVIGLPKEGSPFPLAFLLMPRRHADLQDLNGPEARSQGELLTAIERVARQVMHVPRIQVARWGDGAHHLHWWITARPTGMLQLRGTFMALWSLVLPAREAQAGRAAALEVLSHLVQAGHGELIAP